MLLDILLSQWMRFFGRAEAGKGSIFGIYEPPNRRDARAIAARRRCHRAGATLCKPAAQMRIIQPRLIANASSTHVVLDIDLVVSALLLQVNSLSGCVSL